VCESINLSFLKPILNSFLLCAFTDIRNAFLGIFEDGVLLNCASNSSQNNAGKCQLDLGSPFVNHTQQGWAEKCW